MCKLNSCFHYFNSSAQVWSTQRFFLCNFAIFTHIIFILNHFSTMADSKCESIVTKGDALAGSILTLSDLKHLSSCMTKSLDELLIYAKDTIDECSSTNTLLNQIRVISAASTKMEENLTHLTKLEGGVVITKRISSMANADMNIEKKRHDKLHPRKPDPNFVGLYSSKLKSIMKSHTPTKRKHKIVSP